MKFFIKLFFYEFYIYELIAESKSKCNANKNSSLALHSPATALEKYLDNLQVQGITAVQFDKYWVSNPRGAEGKLTIL